MRLIFEFSCKKKKGYSRKYNNFGSRNDTKKIFKNKNWGELIKYNSGGEKKFSSKNFDRKPRFDNRNSEQDHPGTKKQKISFSG